MTTRKKTLIGIFSLFMLATSSLQVNAQSELENVDLTNSKFTFEIKEYADSTLNKDISINISVPILTGEKVATTKINKTILSFMTNCATASNNKEISLINQATNYEEVVRLYMTDAKASKQAIKEEFTDKETPSYVNELRLDGTVLCSNSKIVNIGVAMGSYGGGAHGFASISSLLFDAETGEMYALTLEDLFKDYNLFMMIAEKSFRTDYQLADDASLNDAGFWFKDNKFILPTKLLILDEGLLFVYKQYEIGPYSMGMPQIFIPYQEIKSILNFDKIGITPIK